MWDSIFQQTLYDIKWQITLLVLSQFYMNLIWTSYFFKYAPTSPHFDNMWYLYRLVPSKSIGVIVSRAKELLKGLLVLAYYKGIPNWPRPIDNAGEERISRGGYIVLSMNQMRCRDPPDIDRKSVV